MTSVHRSQPLAALHALLNRHHQAIVFFYFVFLLILGVLIFDQYGISMDEPVRRNNGGISLRYVLERLNLPILTADPILALQSTPLMQYHDRDYGVSFDLPAFFIERLLSLDDSRDQYLLRHFLTFLVFFLGVVSIYKLATTHFNDWRYGLLAATIFVTSPRIFGEAFYNNKDIVFMSLIAVCMYTACRLNFSLSCQSAMVHALATAFAITVRIPGVIFVLLTACALTALLTFKKISPKKYLFLELIYITTTLVVVYVLWPWLWDTPVAHAVQAFRNMARFRWDHYTLFLGEFVSAKNLPWHYTPVWIGITTPVVFVVFSLVGIGHVISETLRSKLYNVTTLHGMQDLMIVGITIGPIVITAALGSTLYDGWRQLYFVYPGIIFLIIKGIQFFAERPIFGRNTLKIAFSILCFQIAVNIIWMVKWHPYQYLYFNALAQDAPKQRFEWDFWGVTTLDGLKHILAFDSRNKITIAAIGANALLQSISMLPANDRDRLAPMQADQNPDYLISNHRFLHKAHVGKPSEAYAPIYKTNVDGREVLTVFRRLVD
jgi:hypothetical protein